MNRTQFLDKQKRPQKRKLTKCGEGSESNVYGNAEITQGICLYELYLAVNFFSGLIPCNLSQTQKQK